MLAHGAGFTRDSPDNAKGLIRRAGRESSLVSDDATPRRPRPEVISEPLGVQALEASEPWALRNSTWIVTLGGLMTTLFGLVAIFVLPTVDRVVGNFAGGDLQRARADIRTSGLAMATGVGAATAGLLAWGRLELSRRQHRIDRERYAFDEALQSRQHALAEQSQRNERFARAVELLGHSDLSVRLGALYALEGLARDNFDRQTVYDVVSAYARNHVRPSATFEVLEREVAGWVDHGDESVEEGEIDTIHPEDIPTDDDYEAAITICLRVPVDWSVEVDLRDTVIVGRVFRDVADANFNGSTFRDCHFAAATIARCSFLRASLTGCRFLGATIVDCRFAEAAMSACLFSEVTVVGSSLDSTALEDSVFDSVQYDPTTSWPAGQPPVGTTANGPTS